MASVLVELFSIDGRTNVTTRTLSIPLRSNRGHLFTLTLISPAPWPDKQFVLVTPVLLTSEATYRSSEALKIYPTNERAMISVAVPAGLTNGDVDVAFDISPRYYGPSGGAAGVSEFQLRYEDDVRETVAIAL